MLGVGTYTPLCGDCVALTVCPSHALKQVKALTVSQQFGCGNVAGKLFLQSVNDA